MKNWKAWGALIAILALIYFMAFHWDRFLSDFWPIDASRIAPNVVASVVQWALLGFLAYLLYPPVKRAVDAYAARHVDSIKAHVSAEHAAVHAKLDHVIKFHPDIPDFPARENDGRNQSN